MGFFASLFGNKKPQNVQIVTDRIWITTNAKFAGLAREIADRSTSGTVAVLLVAHFPDVLARLSKLAAQPVNGAPVMAVLASDLSRAIAPSLTVDPSALIDIIVGERHPLPSADERLEQFAGELPCRCRITHHLSLDDPVIKIFAGQWVQNLLEKLGLTEDEAIESELASRRIKQAQQKIEGRVSRNSHAESATAWLEKNCPELTKR